LSSRNPKEKIVATERRLSRTAEKSGKGSVRQETRSLKNFSYNEGKSNKVKPHASTLKLSESSDEA
jgi:hypothetical protein